MDSVGGPQADLSFCGEEFLIGGGCKTTNVMFGEGDAPTCSGGGQHPSLAILHYLKTIISGGCRAMEYIKSIIDLRMLIQCMHFPFNALRRVQIIQGSKPTFWPFDHEYASMKLLVELWYYIHVKFKERQTSALTQVEFLTAPIHYSHGANLCTFVQ